VRFVSLASCLETCEAISSASVHVQGVVADMLSGDWELGIVIIDLGGVTPKMSAGVSVRGGRLSFGAVSVLGMATIIEWESCRFGCAGGKLLWSILYAISLQKSNSFMLPCLWFSLV